MPPPAELKQKDESLLLLMVLFRITAALEKTEMPPPLHPLFPVIMLPSIVGDESEMTMPPLLPCVMVKPRRTDRGPSKFKAKTGVWNPIPSITVAPGPPALAIVIALPRKLTCSE